MRVRILSCAVRAYGMSCVSWHPVAAQSPSFDCNRAHLPDEIAICRTPELAELDNTIAAAYATSRRPEAAHTQTKLEFHFGD